MLLRILPLIALTCLCRADETQAKRSPKEWAEELSAIYAKHSGFKVSYESRGKGKSLTATLARDKSGDAVLHVQATKDGQSFEMRVWNLEDTMFVIAGGKVMAATDMGKITKKLDEMSRELDLSSGSGPRVTYGFTPQFLLSGDSINGGLGLVNAAKPPWDSNVSNATAAEADAQEVVFHTPDHGKLTVNRKTGMMTRQEIDGPDGEKRQLLLSTLEMDPGREAVVEMRRDWNPEGAEEMDVKSILRATPLLIFQLTIGFVDLGVNTPDKLKEVLAAKSDYLRGVFRSYTKARKDIDPAQRERWQERVAEGKKLMKAKPEDPAAKVEVRELLAKDRPVEAAEVFKAIFGKNLDELANTSNENGKEAKKLIGEAIARAYSEAEIERRVEEFW